MAGCGPATVVYEVPRLRLLGTGTSFGVPQLACDCAVCRSTDPRDRRGRSSALIESASTTILIDTPPELRLSLLTAGTTRLDGVIFTHEHADHVGGIDDLRIFSLRQRQEIPVHATARTAEFLRTSYRYIFDDSVVPIPGTSKPRLALRPLVPGTPVDIGDLSLLPLEFDHGNTPVIGVRLGRMAYLTDVKAITAPMRDRLRGLDVLVLNALWWRSHPTHLSIPEAIETASDIGARRTILTHLTHETGHAELAGQLPPGIEPGYDGLTVEVAE